VVGIARNAIKVYNKYLIALVISFFLGLGLKRKVKISQLQFCARNYRRNTRFLRQKKAPAYAGADYLKIKFSIYLN
jgi:hypothetical protein